MVQLLLPERLGKCAELNPIKMVQLLLSLDRVPVLWTTTSVAGVLATGNGERGQETHTYAHAPADDSSLVVVHSVVVASTGPFHTRVRQDVVHR